MWNSTTVFGNSGAGLQPARDLQSRFSETVEA
jgi:hypothetical protein